MADLTNTADLPRTVLRVDRLIAVNCFDLSPSFVTKENVHDFWEFVYVDGGEAVCYAGERQTLLRQGDMIFHYPGEVHSLVCNGKQAASIFSVLFDCSSEAVRLFTDRSIRVPARQIHLLKTLIAECTKVYHVSAYPLRRRSAAPLGGEQLTQVYTEEFLLLILRECLKTEAAAAAKTPGRETDDTLVRDICRYLSERVREKVTLKMLSEEFHFGKSHLCEHFRQSQGCSIMNYHMELRIAEAKRLLREESMTINEISEELGFESPEFFSRSFKKKVGYTPRAFRKMLINDSSLCHRDS